MEGKYQLSPNMNKERGKYQEIFVGKVGRTSSSMHLKENRINDGFLGVWLEILAGNWVCRG